MVFRRVEWGIRGHFGPLGLTQGLPASEVYRSLTELLRGGVFPPFEASTSRHVLISIIILVNFLVIYLIRNKGLTLPAACGMVFWRVEWGIRGHFGPFGLPQGLPASGVFKT